MAIQSIGIDIREASQHGTGKGRFTLEWVWAFIEQAPDLQIFLFSKTPNPHFPSAGNVRQMVVKGRGVLWHWNLRKTLQQHPVDLFLSPTSFIYPAIAPRHQKTAVVVHDLIAFKHAQSHPWFPTWVERLTLPRALKKTSLVLCVSEHTKKDLLHLFPWVRQTLMCITPPAVAPEVHAVDTQKMDLPTHFLLGVGTLLPRKNFQLIFHALERLAPVHPDLHLCIAGRESAKSAEIYKTVPPTLADRIHFLGSVSADQLNELYSRAQMLVFPSEYEGFGIPPLEAMACGCPVIVSKATSLPEVVGTAALQVPLNDPDALATAIETVLKPAEAHALIKKGYEQVKKFSWKGSAKVFLEGMHTK